VSQRINTTKKHASQHLLGAVILVAFKSSIERSLKRENRRLEGGLLREED